MATSASVSVFCPVCYREYSDSDSDLIPRILPCGHSFCTECLGRLLENEEEEEEEERVRNLEFLLTRRLLGLGGRHSNEVTCPVCKTTNHVHGGNVNSLTKNFALLGASDGGERSSHHYCQEHDHEQRIYCLECQQLVCAYCQLYGIHKSHKCQIATEACEPAVSAIRDLLSEIEGHVKDLQEGEAAVLSHIQRLERRREKSETIIRSHYGYFIRILQQKMNDELEKMQSWSDEQAVILQAQLRSVSGTRKTCQRLVDDCQRITERDPLQALYEQEPLTSRSEDIKTAAKQLPREPIIRPSIDCKQTEFSENIEHLQALRDSLTVSTTLEATDEEEEEEERETPISDTIGTLFHAQDTNNLTDGATCSPKLFPGDPSPSMTTPSSPPPYSTDHRHLYGGAQSPASSNSSDEYKILRFRAPHFWSPVLHSRSDFPPHAAAPVNDTVQLALAQCVITDIASFINRGRGDALTTEDDDSYLPDPLDYSPPRTLSVPSILPGNNHVMSDDVSVAVGSEAQGGLHVSVTSSGWPTFTSILPDSLNTTNDSN